MPIIKHEDVSMERHVLPILRHHGYSLKQDGELEWFANGKPISICNTNDLWTTDKAIAELLEKECRPFGEPLNVHLHIY